MTVGGWVGGLGQGRRVQDGCLVHRIKKTFHPHRNLVLEVGAIGAWLAW